MIKDNIKSILDEISDYDAKLIAVSKTRTIEEILEAYNVGIRDFGENHVQELVKKRVLLPKDIRWHMIGHLQTNKVKDLLKDSVYLIHSVDSIKLAKEINKRSSIKQDILLEVNIGEEKSKYGFKPSFDELKKVLDEINNLNNINVVGLMCVAPNTDNPIDNKKYFDKLRLLNEKLGLKVLSMGMSNDYDVAIKCGSTYIRVGTKIFGKREYKKKIN